MLGSILLFLLILSSTVSSSERLSQSCGCAILSVDSFYAQRIPSKITELVCVQPDAACSDQHSRVSISHGQALKAFSVFDFCYSVVNWPDFWRLDTLRKLENRKWLCIEEMSALGWVAFANRLPFEDFYNLQTTTQIEKKKKSFNRFPELNVWLYPNISNT